MLENLLFSMNSTMPLFFIMLLGYVLHRTGFLSDAFVAGANKFVFYVALPVQLFRDLGKNDVRATFDGRYVLFCFAVTLACILVIWALAKLFLRAPALWASSFRCVTARRLPSSARLFCRASTAMPACPA